MTVLAGALQVDVGALADLVDRLSLAGNTLQGHDRDSSPLDEHLGRQEAPSEGLTPEHRHPTGKDTPQHLVLQGGIALHQPSLC